MLRCIASMISREPSAPAILAMPTMRPRRWRAPTRHRQATETSTGDKSIAGPGYGKFVQAELPNVGPGDIIAFKLTNETKGNTFWGFTQANETVDGQKVVHLWNYGLNTLGFEDRYGGGDKDYNDVIVGVDFTSASGQGLLVR